MRATLDLSVDSKSCFDNNESNEVECTRTASGDSLNAKVTSKVNIGQRRSNPTTLVTLSGEERDIQTASDIVDEITTGNLAGYVNRTSGFSQFEFLSVSSQIINTNINTNINENENTNNNNNIVNVIAGDSGSDTSIYIALGAACIVALSGFVYASGRSAPFQVGRGDSLILHDKSAHDML